MAIKITVPVDFQDSAQSYKKIIASLQSELKKVKPGTAIYENISSQLKKANNLISKLEGNIGQGAASHAEIERIIRDFSSLRTVVESVNDAYATMSIKNLNINSDNFGTLAKDLVDAASQLAKAKKALSDAEGLNIGELFQGDTNIGKFTSKQLTSKGKNFYDGLAAQIERLGIKSNEAEQEVKTLERSLADLQQQADNLKNDSLAEAITGIVGTAGSKTSKKGQFISLTDAQTNLLNITQNKFFTKKGLKAGVSQDQVKDWLKAFGISDESIAKILETSKDRIERLRQAINAEFTNSKKNQLVTQYRDAAAESIQRQAVEKQIAEVNANLKTARSTVSDYSGELKGIQEQFNLLKDKLIKRGILGATEGEAGDLQKQIDAIEQQIASLQSAIVAQGPKVANNLPDAPSREAIDQDFDAERDAQQFKDNLKQAIAHWLSAQQVITMVKEGIRQAWTDIQGLDKAMTNIAVVTDMSVSDLWGKINDYMAIAQEYGVTTQGVYEVSQLYYQQGLSTNEVMKATTETLKMARIAGMDYAEAADAMTVAIRAFKMEMSDAQVITDVYSKVAAVTASDSQELAIAMSKTASSAESVGSSFENTTAMLAVMIETTRESAQNLGSALKSIISRYGEMKVGLTVDSEGEEIDYNKVDTALQSVGISIKDAQGQFRDFDEVIFELSKKWDSLDKNTQRYIATIMAGNRQQSRFIALVDNWERLEEVSAAAYDSQDAGLLQYAKTLDSLETKLNALSTSFQQFYMSIVNGDTFKGIIDMITNFINGLNQLGSWPAILNVGLLLKSLKTIASTFVNSFSNPLSGIVNQYKSTFSQITSLAFSEGVKAGQNHAKGVEVGISNSSVQSGVTGTTKRRIQGIKTGTDRKFIRKKGFELRQQQQQNDPFSLTNKQAKFAKGASIVGPLLTMLGTSVANKHAGWGATISGFGNVASGIAAGAGFGIGGMVAGGTIAALASLPGIIEGINQLDVQKIQHAEEALNKAEITRATKKEEARNLQSTIENLRKLQKARYSSEEAEKAFIEASNAAFEQFPQLTATFDETGNAIIDVISKTSNAEQLLIEARMAAAVAAEEAAAAELKLNAEKEEQAQNEYDKYYKSSRKVDTFARDIDQQNSYINFDSEAYQGKSLVEVADGYFSAIETYLANEAKDLRDLGHDEEYIQSEITKERDFLEGSFFRRLPGMGISLDDDDLSLRGFNAAATQAIQRLKSTTGARTSSQEASINRVIDNALLSIETAPQANTDWLKIEGITDIFYGRIEEVIGNPETIFDPLTKELLPEVKDVIYATLTTYTTAWNEISEHLATSYQTEDFNGLISSFKKGSITFSEFEEQYAKLFEGVKLSEEAQKEIDNVSRDLWTDNINATRNLATTLSDKNGFKWDNYGPLFRKLKEIPQQYFANLYDFSETIDAQLEEGLINESQAKDLTSRYLQMWEGLGASGLDSETLGQARNALASANLFSIDGINTLTTTLKDLGVETDNLPGLKDFPVYAVNFTTEYATLIEKMNKGMESLRELLSNLADGLETEDAEKLAKKMGTTLSDSSAFEFIDGKWYVKNVETAIAAIEKTYSSLQAQLKTTLDDSVGKLSDPTKASDEEIKQLVSINEESAKKWAAEQAAKGITNLPDFDSDDGKRSLVAAYLQAEYEGITQAYETEKAWLMAEAERSVRISSRARELSGGEEKTRKRQSWDLIKSNGLNGYSAEDIAQIEEDLGISPDAFINKGDGTWDLDYTKLSNIPTDVRNAILASIDNEAQSAISAIESLGSSLAKEKEPGAYAEAFSAYTEKMGYEWVEKIIPARIRSAANGSVNNERLLKNNIANELRAKGVEISGIDDPQVTKAYNELIAGYKDGIVDNQVRFLELSKKQIEGTITEIESVELANLNIEGATWAAELTEKLKNIDLSIIQKNQAILDAAINSSLDWYLIEDTVQQGYSDLINAYQAKAQGLAITDLGALEVSDGIIDQAGFYSSDSLAQMFTQAQKEGHTMDFSKFEEVFQWDSITNSWILTAGAELSTLFEKDAPEWLKQVFTKSENKKAISEAVRIDEAGASITEAISNLYSNAADASLNDLISLYETIHGEGSFAEADGDLLGEYQEALAQAKAGNVEVLREHLWTLVDMADKKGIELGDLGIAIQDATFAIVQTIMGNIESAVSGSLSAEGLDSLTKEFDIDFSKYAEATIDGYKISTEGMLQLGSAMMQQYGDTYEVAEKMYDLFVGNGGIYKGYSELIKAAEALKDENGKISEEYEDQYNLLINMANIARFNEDDPLFNFMDQDPTEGFGGGARSTIESIKSFKDALNSLKDGGTISYDEFGSMMNYMYEQAGDWSTFAQNLGLSGEAIAKFEGYAEKGADVYSSFVSTIIEGSKSLEGVDSKTLMDLGISMEGMASGMKKSLKDVADEQIAALEGLRDTLLAFKALEEIGKIGIKLDITGPEGQPITLLNFENFITEDNKDKLTEAINTKIGQVKKIFADLGIKIDWNTIFGEDGGFTLGEDNHIVKNIGQAIQTFGSNPSAELWTQLARRWFPNAEKGGPSSEQWQALIEKIAKATDWNAFINGIDDEVQKNLNESLEKIDGVSFTEGNQIHLTDEITESIIEQVKAEYAKLGYEGIEITEDGQTLTVTIVNPKIQAAIKESDLQWDFSSEDKSYTAQTTIDGIKTEITVSELGEVTYKTPDGGVLDDTKIQQFLEEQGLNVEKIINDSGQGSLQLNLSVSQQTSEATSTINEDVAAIRQALENPLKIEIESEEAGTQLDNIQTKYENLVNTFKNNPLTIAVSGGPGTSGTPSTPSTDTNTSKDNSSQQDLETSTVEQEIFVSWLNLDSWHRDELSQDVDIYYFTDDSWEQEHLVQDVYVNYVVDEEPPLYKGNVQEDPPGPNSAKGNVKLLKAGAAFARGTLMGELGPELYVQNGSYHIAGATGPEFVNLAPDAIVFNHLQTANLLGKGHTNKTGSPVTSERRSVSAFATGNVSGPAFASGLDNAIAAINNAIAMWKKISDASTSDLLGGSGGGGGGSEKGSEESLKARIAELQEWYNLTRKIAKAEKEINYILAKRENIKPADGEKYLRSLREQEKVLNRQLATQGNLLEFQEIQLSRQANHINKNKIWSKFLTVSSNGLLQYKEGNESTGKGALTVLQQLNKMSGKKQSEYLKKIGYSYTDADGNKLQGEELVEKFFEELQAQIDQYDALYDTVYDTKTELEKIKTTISDINKEIKENQKDLEQEIYDIITSAWEKEIEEMEKQASLIKEANEAYIEGLNEALSEERQMYDDNQKIADREALQRRLSLLRRSGGSASEIASLEEQLDGMLKDEYFSNQEKAIENLQKASDIQIEKLQTQIDLEKESLEYQKQHGIIWSKVHEVLEGSKDSILSFMQGKSPEFFSQSLLQQEDMLTEWARKIGIFTENKEYQAQAKVGEKIWNERFWKLTNAKGETMGENFKETYEGMKEEDQATIKDLFVSTYADAILEGQTEEEALETARKTTATTLKKQKEADEADPKHWKFTFRNKEYKHYTSEEEAKAAIEDKYLERRREIRKTLPERDWDEQYARAKLSKKKALESLTSDRHSKGYSEGGIVDYTGVAVVHGTPKKPEAFLNAEQTAQIRAGLENSSKKSVLDSIKDTLMQLNSTIKSIVKIDNKTESNTYTIAPGAVVIQVEQLNDAYDVDTLSTDVMNRIYAISNKSTNRGINRR